VYIPAHFREDRIEVLHAAIRAAGPATLISTTSQGLFASHAPLMLDTHAGPSGTLFGHFAKANPHTAIMEKASETLAIFHGPSGYITPSYYAAKREHGKVVPTWNYVAIHAYGTLETIEDQDALLDLVTRLTDLHETPRAAPWAVDDAPADFIQGMLRGIIGFRLLITRLEGKLKMSQNRPAQDTKGVVEGLRSDGRGDLAQAVTDAVKGT
jgi:transcriptional regulator